jgi:tagatose-1,6-bisphosphate aldolase non-catalytic subunit AgaZ/GatZ
MPLREDVSLDAIVRATRALAERGERITHLGICPMSEELIRIPIELAVRHDFPLLFVASRNQVSNEEGGGYVMGLTPETFMQKIVEIEESLGAHSERAPAYLRSVGVDHCGPWYRECEKSHGEDDALESVKESLSACLKAGYTAFHIDCSFLPPPHVTMDEAKRVRLTADLFDFTEKERLALGRPPVSYEIGTEETAGASVSAEHFRESIKKMASELKKRNLPQPAFVVGRTGAKIEMLENVGGFDYTAASSLPRIAEEFNIGFKEHNADYLSTPILSLHPEYRITCANVGPSFAAAQTRALLDLADREAGAIAGGGSGMYEVMSEAVLERAPFAKWLRKKDNWTKNTLKGEPSALRAVTMVTGHYVYYDEDVKKAIAALYANLRKNDVLEHPEEYVAAAIRAAVMRYVDSFNLRKSTSKILQNLEEEGSSR